MSGLSASLVVMM